MELPESFKIQMKAQLGEEYPAFIESYSSGSVQGIRVNTGKIPADEFAAASPFALQHVPWTLNGFYITKGEQVTKHPYYYAGLYYVQEPSAMLPAALLGAEPGDRILDLCAAPGGKATELGSRLCGSGVLIANDISHSRAKALLKNLEMHGIGNIMVCSETPEKLAAVYENYFDKILVDAPCSGEGMFRRDAAMLNAYRQHGPSHYAKIQAEIVKSAVHMLKPGGRMVYSTCTFSEAEDEDTVLWLLKEYPQMRLIPAHVPGGCDLPEKLAGCVRLYPHRAGAEGHFAAVLEKETAGGKIESPAAPQRSAGSAENKLSESEQALWSEFAKKYLRRSFDGWKLFCMEGRLYALPAGAERKKGLRYLRTGLLLGEYKKHSFEPSQALAMFLKAGEAAHAIMLPAKDERIKRYLKGETITLAEHEENGPNGWVLVCADNYPLGWAKWVNGSLRNKYYAGWRMN